MRKLSVFSALFILLSFSSLFAMPASDTADPKLKPVIAVSILPQQFFVEQIAGDDFDVLVLVGPGQSPHSYEPTPRQLERLSRASLWILSGTDFEEALLPKIRSQFPRLPIQDGTEGVVFRHMDEGHGDDDDDDHHHHHNEDPHTWLGREPAKIMAGHIRDALSRIKPDNETPYTQRYAALVSNIDAVFDSLAIRLAPLAGTTVLVYHPAFGYFFDEFGIQQEAVETGGREPTVRTLARLVEQAKHDNARAIFVQEQFSTDSAKRIADELGVPVVPLNPLSPEWLENITMMGTALESSLINNSR